MALQTLNTIKSWFKTGLKPSQNQFWDTWDSFRHKNEKIPLQDIENLETTLNTKENKFNKGIANGYVPLNTFSKIANQYLDIVNDLVSGGSNSLLSAEQGKILQNQINEVINLLKSDNTNLNTLQKIVNTIEEIQKSISIILVNDLTTGGVTKALTAEMGKQLQNTKLTASIATDAETQTIVAIDEDNKVVSRSKLFNWWAWIKSNVQTINAIWNFPRGIKAEGNAGDYTFTSKMNTGNFSVQCKYDDNYDTSTFEIGLIRWIKNGITTVLMPYGGLQDNTIFLPNKSGHIALENDFIVTAEGTTDKPPLIIPRGELTSYAHNGAIERDLDGCLYDTALDNNRNRILTENNAITLFTKGSATQTDNSHNKTTEVERNIKSIPSSTFSNISFGSLYVSVDASWGETVGTVQPNVFKIEYFLKLVNGFFSSSTWGSDNLGQYIKIADMNLLQSWPINQTFTLSYSNSFRTHCNNNGKNGNRCGVGIGDDFYNTRKLDNSDNELPFNCQFEIIERITWEYSDENNTNGDNMMKRAIAGVNAFYIEKII
ncbi:hypothetical protein ABXT06_17840 [Flavobacterium sp. UW10123]|uniref:hypothetical protein n=1 Tax=Flavobacterium sp. UW10123 TaxID=3230800 RepID=UPI0033908880